MLIAITRVVPWLQAAPDAGGLSPALDGGPKAHDRVRVHVYPAGEAHQPGGGRTR